MPVVPTYGDRQVRTEALRPAMAQNMDVSSGGRAIGQALMSVSDDVDRIALRNSEVKANEADTQITRAWNAWEDENRGKFTNQTAEGYTQAVDAWWKDAAKTYGAELDPRAQNMVGKALSRRQTLALDQAGKYETAEKEKYADSTTAAAIDTATVTALKGGDYEGEAARIRDLVAAQGVRKNWDKTQRDSELNHRLGNYHTAVVTQLAEANAERAKKYLEAAIQRGEVPADRQTRLETVIKGEADNQFATQQAAHMANLPLAEQLAQASKIEDPQRREKTLVQVRNNYALVKQAQAEQEAAAADAAWQGVARGQRVPESVLSRMNGRERVQLNDYLQAKAKQRAEGTTTKTNPQALARVYDMMRDDPEGFKKLRMEPLTTAIGPSDMAQIARVQRDMLKPNTEKDVATTAQLLGTYTGGWKAEKRAVFESAAYEELARFEKEKGRPANYSEKKKLLDPLLIEGEVMSGSWYKNDPDKKLYETTPEERKRFAPAITSDDRKLVVQALKAEGIDRPSDDQILQRYKLAKGIK